jgi:hypothetical protein
MPSRSTSWRQPAGLGLAVALLALADAHSCRADLIFLKDGFVLSGQVKREEAIEVDPYSHEPFRVPKGFFLLDDGPRRIVFSPSHVGDVRKKERPDEERVLNNKKQIIIPGAGAMPPLLEVLETPPFDRDWERVIRFRSSNGAAALPQRLVLLTPYFATGVALKHVRWGCCYLTRELGPEQVGQLLLNHPDFKEDGVAPADVISRRFRYIDFFAQAGWYPEAERELRRLMQDFPDARERAQRSLAVLGGFRARDRLEEIKRLHASAQYALVRKRLDGFPEENAPAAVLAEVTALKTDYDNAAKRLAEAARLLDELPKGVSEHKELFVEAAAALRDEIHLESLPRLDTFLLQAQQYERQRKENRTPDLGPAELLSLAVSGYLLGGASAEAKPATAIRLWHARKLVLEYQKTAEVAARQQLLNAYLKDRDGQPALDEVLQLIPNLPPPEPEDVQPGATVELQAGGGGPQGNPGRGGASYLVQVPPEYRPGRQYPVLIVLHDGNEKPRDMLRRWSGPAAEHGYFLVAPAWAGAGAFANSYTYSEREHAAVLDVIRDLRRRFNVDSDRIFLFGLGQGAVMAFDVGLAHPDLFAGVSTMGDGPHFFAERYWRNGQYLPFYVVQGDAAGESNKRVKELFDLWIGRAFPMLWVQYKGRGGEWFVGEQANIFDWMRAKRRAWPLRQLGIDGLGERLGTEFQTMRPGDNRFYWLTTDAILPRCLNSAANWNNRVEAATLHARINQQTNEIYIRLTGVRQATIWLGRTARGESMVDFDKPVSVRAGLNVIFNRRIQPSLQVLLEDLYQRGDRQRLFLARIDLNF